MADSTADFTKKILVDIEVKSEQVKRDIPVLTQSIQDLTDAQKILEAQGKKNTIQYQNNASQIRLLKTEVRDLNKYVDNTAKAINAESNSIQQNRALLSLMTAEHIKLGQANGNTKAQIDESAKAINKLTDVLKAQEKAIGQTYRNVGNYSDAIREVMGQIGGAVPGFQQFNQVLQTATKIGGFLPSALANVSTAIGKTSSQITSFVGFKQFGTQAVEAEKSNENLAKAVQEVSQSIEGVKKEASAAAGPIESLKEAENGVSQAAEQVAVTTEKAEGGFSLLSVGGLALAGVLSGVALVASSVIAYFKDLDVVTDGLAQNTGAFKTAFSELGRILSGNDEGDYGDKSFVLIDRIKKVAQVFQQQKGLIDEQQQLEDSLLNNTVESGKRLAEVYKLQVEAKNKTLDPGQSQQLLDKASAIDLADLKSKENLVKREIDLAKQSIYISGNLKDYQKKNLDERGVEYALYLQNNLVKQGKVTDAQTKALATALQKQTDIQQDYTQREEKRQNLSDSRDEKDQAKKDAQDAKNRAAAEKAERLLEAQKAAQAEAENIRASSAARVLQNIYEEYGDRAVAADTSYNNELTKLKKFLAKKLITQAEYNAVEKQLRSEHESTIQKIISDFQKKDFDAYQTSSNELKNLQIQNIQNDTERTVQGLQERGAEQLQALEKNNQQHLENIEALNVEIDNLSGEEQAEARARRVAEEVEIELNSKKKIELEKATAEAILKTQRKAAQDQQALKDNNDVTEASSKFGGGSSQALAAKITQLHNERDAELSVTGLTEQAKFEIRRKYDLMEDDAKKQHRNKVIEDVYAGEQQVQSGIYDIISQGIQQQQDQALAALSAKKDAELSNTSLTNTQKKLIDAKYKKEEDKVKLKAFKDNQKLQVANILINGAVAVVKNIAELGFIPSIPVNALTVALTALSIGKVLSQKPAFASGGVFESDGRGAVLPGYSKHDNVNARLRSGEGVVVSEAMRDPYARSVVSGINVKYGGRSFVSSGMQKAFAQGGIYTDGGSANRYYSQPVTEGQQSAATIYEVLQNMPAPIVDVKDIISQVAIKVQTENRVIS